MEREERQVEKETGRGGGRERWKEKEGGPIIIVQSETKKAFRVVTLSVNIFA